MLYMFLIPFDSQTCPKKDSDIYSHCNFLHLWEYKWNMSEQSSSPKPNSPANMGTMPQPDSPRPVVNPPYSKPSRKMRPNIPFNADERRSLTLVPAKKCTYVKREAKNEEIEPVNLEVEETEKPQRKRFSRYKKELSKGTETESKKAELNDTEKKDGSPDSPIPLPVKKFTRFKKKGTKRKERQFKNELQENMEEPSTINTSPPYRRPSRRMRPNVRGPGSSKPSYNLWNVILLKDQILKWTFILLDWWKFGWFAFVHCS